MGHFCDFVNKRQPDITMLVDQTQERIKRRSGITAEYFPMQNYDDFDLLWVQMQETCAIASIVGYEGEIPATRGGSSLSEVRMRLYKLGISHIWTENDLIKMYQMMGRIDGIPQAFINSIYGTIQKLPMRITDLASVLIWEIAATGACQYTDPRTHVQLDMTYPTLPNLRPADLTGAATWDQVATATGLDDLRDLTEAFYLEHGYFPDELVMSRSNYLQLRQQESTKEAATALSGSAANATNLIISPSQMAEVLEAHEIPPIRTNDNGMVGFDEEVDYEVPGSQTDGVSDFSRRRLLPENYVVFLTKKRSMADSLSSQDTGSMGRRAFGPVASADMRTGIHTFSEEQSKEPPVDRMVSTATYAPVIWDPRLICSRKVG